MLGLLAVLGAVGVGATLVVDGLAVRDALEGARTASLAAVEAIGEGDLAGARDRLEVARRDVEDATVRTSRLVWRAAEQVPYAGATFATLRGAVEVVDQGSGLGTAALGGLEPLVGPGGALVVQPQDGRLPADVLEAARRVGAALRPDGFRDALDALREVRGPVPGVVADGRDRILDVGDAVADRLEVAVPLLEAVPSFLGTDGPKRYLLAMQNPAELRGTGGLIGFTAELHADRGLLSISRPASYTALDALGRDQAGDLPPVDAPPAFQARYADQHAAGFLANVNVDPDLPTTGPVLLDLVEDRTRRRFDGVVLVDPIGLAHVLARIGPVAVDPAVAATAPQLPATIAPERFADLVMVEHYAAFEGRNEARRAWLSEVATAAFTRITDAEWDGAAVTTAIVEAAGAGHLAFSVRDPEQQAAFAAADLAGALWPADGRDADVLAVTANNSAGNKLDRHVVHRLVADVALAGDPTAGLLSRTTRLEATVDNPVTPGTFSTYVEGSFPVSEGTRTPRSDQRALVRTWWSVWAPALHQLTVAATDGPQPGGWVIHGQRVADATVETGPGASSTVTAVVSGTVPADVTSAGDRAVYRLHVRRQPKAIPDDLQLTIRPPDGWRVAEGSVAGGDAAVGVDGTPPVLQVQPDGTAQVAGRTTSHLLVEVVLARS